jgi:glycosyltransferase involved in cell wall biosynthesis
MAAPGIRCFEMARELADAGHEVTLAIPNEPEIDTTAFHQLQFRRRLPADLTQRSDVVVVGGAGHNIMPAIRIPRAKPRVIDLSFPVALEILAVGDQEKTVWPPPVPAQNLASRLARYLYESDMLLCASDQQRQLYLGALLMTGRIDPTLLRDDPALSKLIAIAGFGCPSELPIKTGPGPRELIQGVSRGDYVLVWSGGLGDWYDPETVIRAIAAAADRVERLRMVFMGTNPREGHLAHTSAAQRAYDLARHLGLLNRNVFFYEQWIPYEDRANWLCDVDVAVVASPYTLESEMAVRTRFLDYFWTATPVICTAGGIYADEIERDRLGIVVASGDVDAMAKAIVSASRLSMRDGMRTRLRAARDRHTWHSSLRPLVEFVANPRRAVDRSEAGWPRMWDLKLGSLKASDNWRVYTHLARNRFKRGDSAT